MSYLVDVNGNPFMSDVITQASNLGALNAAVTMQQRGQASAAIQVTGIGTLTLSFEATIDNVNFFSVVAYPIGGGAAVTSTSTNGQWNVDTAGFYQFRVRVSAYTSGSAIVSVICSQGGDVVQALDAAGTARNNLVSVAGTALGTPTNFGTTPGAVVAASVNSSAFVGTTVAVAASAGIQKVGIVGNAGSAAIFDGATAAAVPANALLGGARAQNANPTAVTNGQMVAVAADLAGRIITTPLNYRTQIGQTATTISATGATTIVAAGAASVFRDICLIVVTTAGAAAQTITFSDGTLSWIVDYPNAALAPGTPLVISFGEVPLRVNAAATAFTANQGAATACHYLVQYVERLA